MIIHHEPSPLAGKTVAIVAGPMAGQQILIEDWWDRIAGRSWMDCDGNGACLKYAVISAGAPPFCDEVLYGKIGYLGNIVHESWLEGAGAAPEAAEVAE